MRRCNISRGMINKVLFPRILSFNFCCCKDSDNRKDISEEDFDVSRLKQRLSNPLQTLDKKTYNKFFGWLYLSIILNCSSQGAIFTRMKKLNSFLRSRKDCVHHRNTYNSREFNAIGSYWNLALTSANPLVLRSVINFAWITDCKQKSLVGRQRKTSGLSRQRCRWEKRKKLTSKKTNIRNVIYLLFMIKNAFDV